ncbi:MAG: hypothetical protein L7H03_05140, partial [Vulcanisaeta sp.]|nr:hypothetical protein [Vulcanisaeta sp.]MCG2885868.1 hypothetical protein [Vulcanisaeta sp.]
HTPRVNPAQFRVHWNRVLRMKIKPNVQSFETNFYKFFDKEGFNFLDKIEKHSPGGVVAPPGASPVAT